MLKDKFKLAYFNGCSFTQGGGLETIKDVDWNERDENGNEPSLVDGRRDVLKKYKDTYGMPYWNSRLDVAYPAMFSDLSGIKTINDAKSGGGIQRIIRKTNNFLIENWENRKEILIVLEIPDYSRLEFYSKLHNEYVLFNYTIHPETNQVDDWFVCRDYAKRSHSDDNNELRPHFNHIVKSILEPREIFKNITIQLLNFISFLKLSEVEFYITKDVDYGLIGAKEQLFSDRVIPFGSSHDYAIKNMGQISDEVSIDDTHPGVLGHKAYAKELYNYLSDKLR